MEITEMQKQCPSLSFKLSLSRSQLSISDCQVTSS